MSRVDSLVTQALVQGESDVRGVLVGVQVLYGLDDNSLPEVYLTGVQVLLEAKGARVFTTFDTNYKRA